eukprot:gene26328-31805_t
MTLGPKEQEAKCRYEQIGASLRDHPAVVDIRTRLKSIKSLDESPLRFFAVIAPSGSGKTQLPYCIRTNKFPCVHVSLRWRQYENAPQHICNALEGSNDFYFALMSDLDRYGNSLRKALGSSDLPHFSGVLLGCAAVQYFLSSKDTRAPVAASTVPDLRQFVQNMKVRHRPVFFLDDSILYSSDEQKDLIRYARNLLRSVGLVVVVMSPDSGVANLSLAGSKSRGPEEIPVWCSVITELPPLTKASAAVLGLEGTLQKLRRCGHGDIATFLLSHLDTRLPWFVELFCHHTQKLLDETLRELSTASVLDAVLNAMTRTVFDSKSLIMRREGLRAQLAMQLNIHHGESCANHSGLLMKEESHLFVASHFAFLLDSNGLDLYVEDKHLFEMNTGSYWSPQGAFPDPANHALLYLVLGGAFHDYLGNIVQGAAGGARSGLNTFSAFNYIFETQSLLGQSLSLYDCNELSRTGGRLDAMAAVAIAVASRRHGVTGISLQHFLRYLMEEVVVDRRGFDSKRPRSLRVTWAEEPNLGRFDHFTVPYLPPLNMKWPEALLQLQGACFGAFRRTRSGEMIVDVETKGLGKGKGTGFTGECVNYEIPVPLDVIKSCVNRAFKRNKKNVHLIVVSKLEQDYFTGEGAFSKQCRKDVRWHKCSLMRVVAVAQSDSSGIAVSIELSPLFKSMSTLPSSTHCARLMIFVEVEHLTTVSDEVREEGPDQKKMKI